jgi:lipopolysaccharide export LptBFGC system permease protein LptF
VSARLPGRRLRAVAERLFDQTTLERVVLPALADLQHEGDKGQGRWVRVRAYWACVRVLMFCSLRVAVRDTSQTLSIASRRTATTILIIVTGLSVLPVADQLPKLSREAGVMTALTATILLLPQALFVAWPVAHFIGLATGERLHSRLGVVVTSIGCVFLMLFIGNVLTPGANQAYRVLLSNVVHREVTFVQKGLPEMTWSELTDEIRDAPNARRARDARIHRQQRIGYSLAPLVFGLLAFTLAGRWRSRIVSFTLPIGSFLLYWLICAIGAYAAASAGYLVSGIWLGNVVVFLAAISPSFGMARSASAM